MQRDQIIFKSRNPFEETSSYDEWNVYEDYIKEDDIVYDLGANIGWMSEYFCQVGKHVHAFEPVPSLFEQLKNNTKEFSNIDYHKIALSDKDDSGTIVEGQRGTYALGSYMKEKSLPFPDFVKVDIEGFESLFFKTVDFILEKGKTFFFIEMHTWFPSFKFVEDRGFDWNSLKKHPYTVKKFNWKDPDRLWEEPITLGIDDDFNPQKNETFCYLFIPKNI
jgi:hypothetical protein